MKHYKYALVVLLSTLLLMGICFYIGYPVIGGDTSSYMYTAFHRNIPEDRTPFYGMFIRFSSFWESSWYIVFAQSLMLSYVLTRYIQLLYREKSKNLFIVLCIICIVSFTSVAWIVSCLMPDIFTPILLLTVLLYLFDVNASLALRIFYVLIMFIAISEHNTHFLIMLAFSGLLIIYTLIRKKWNWLRKGIVLFSTTLLFWLSMCSLNYSYGNGFTFSRSTHMFLMAKFAESGILVKYLNDNCDKKNFKICSCKDAISPYPWEFMWPPSSSPLYKIRNWDECKPEYDSIIHDILTTPKYFKMYAAKSVISTFKQLAGFQQGNPMNARNPDSYRFIQDYFEDEVGEFKRGKQYEEEINTSNYNLVYTLCFLLSSLWILIYHKQVMTKNILRTYYCISIFLVLNAFVTSTFSTVTDRFQCRVFWILPATNIILILKYTNDKYSNKKVDDYTVTA